MSDVSVALPSGEVVAVLRGSLSRQRAGNWLMQLDQLDRDTTIDGLVSVDWQGTTLSGYVLRSAIENGFAQAHVLGGKGGLTKQLQPKMYDNQLPAALIAQDIASEAGEVLSVRSATALATPLASWVRRAGDAGAQLSALCDALGCVWRVELDGSIWIGVDDYPVVTDWSHDVPQGGWHASYGTLDVIPDTIQAQPGQRYLKEVGGVEIHGRIASVLYSTSDDGPAGHLYFVDDRAPDVDNSAEPLRQFVRETMRGVELHATFTGRVAVQRLDGTLDVYPDDKRLPPFSTVRLRVPVPGAKLTVPPGTRCIIHFEDGDVRRPIAVAYDPGEATAAAALVGDRINAGTWTTTVVSDGGSPPSGTITFLYVNADGAAASLPAPLVITFALGLIVNVTPVGASVASQATAKIVGPGSPHLKLATS